MGISGHPNHRALFAGVRHMLKTMKDPPNAYALLTVSLLRKYTSLLDVAPTFLLVPRVLHFPRKGVDSETRRTSTVLEFAASDVEGEEGNVKHKSQLVWFRYLYVVFARYMFVNELRRINV
ncbi:hypothetical protein BC829DRAFT_91767 [Chytridium lagenaria]|nr:hypothetical protein BC829DRAFT_91767 [Chytridium lagenaria]